MIKNNFKQSCIKIGEICESDFSKLSKEDLNKALVVEKVQEITAPSTNKKNNAVKENPIKKTYKNMSVQTIQPKGVNVACQTIEKDTSKEVLSTLLEIKNKVNNLQSKKDDEVKKLQKKINELTDKLQAKDKKNEKSEADFLKVKYNEMEKKLQAAQNQVSILHKLLLAQVQQKYDCHKIVHTM